MKKRLHILALAVTALLAVGATSVAATTGILAFPSAARSTVAPPPRTKRVQRPQAAKIKSLENALAAAKARVKTLQRELAKAKTQARRKALTKELAQARAKVKALQAAFSAAKRAACGKGYRYAGGKCVRV